MELQIRAVNFPSVSRQQFLDYLSAKEIKRYVSILQVLDTWDPYTAPTGFFSTIKNSEVPPRAPFLQNLHISCRESLAVHCCQDESVQNTEYFCSGWVSNGAIREVKDKTFFFVTVKVKAILADADVTYLPT